ncbi:hypothetical protein Bhyg_00772, partial [Pseudolycoriella hygida]
NLPAHTVRQYVDESENAFFNTISSHIITTLSHYHDARRATLSGWSWPGRYLASQITFNYRRTDCETRADDCTVGTDGCTWTCKFPNERHCLAIRAPPETCTVGTTQP